MSDSRMANARLRPVEPEIVERMRRDVRSETDEVLTEQFGISYNTWRKIRSGQPVRASLASRVEKRLCFADHGDAAGFADGRQPSR